MNPNRIPALYGVAVVAMLGALLAACGGGSSGGGSSGGSSGPVVDFSATPLDADTATVVQFTDLATTGATAFSWDFDNDGTLDSNHRNPTHTYTTPGTYTVSYTVTWPSGTDTVVKADYITVTQAANPTAEIVADTNRDGIITSADNVNKDTWAPGHGAVMYYNIDDDNGNHIEDYLDSGSTGADTLDLAPVMVRQVPGLPGGATATVTVSTAAQGRIGVFRQDGGYSEIYSGGAGFSLPAADLVNGDIALGVEARSRVSPSWNGRATLTLELRDGGGALIDSDAVVLRCAPPIFATNLWEVSEHHLVSITHSYYAPNPELRSAMQAVCSAAGISYRAANGAAYNYDRWLQDSSEPAVVQLPDAAGPRRVIDQVFQCARGRPVDDWCEDTLWGGDFDFFRRFSSNTSSHNYGGNLEIIPPYNGMPYGQIAFGGGTGYLIGTSSTVTHRMHSSYREFFESCELQAPWVEYTSEWLAVGHIDEFTMFIPAPNTARGWVCLIASPDRAYQVLQATQTAGYGSATVFAGRSSQTTVDAILGNSSLGTLNNEVQTRIDQARTQIKNATNLTDADFIELPVLFENVGYNYMAAYNPGVVNLICLPSANGTTYLVIPDPEGPDIGGVDQWQADINAQLSGLDTAANPFDIRYVDVFESYHELLGEAHCGSNTVRVPPADDWWSK